MKTRNIRILFVEDNKTDLEMAVRELRKGKIDFSWETVTTRKELNNKINSYNPDLIICNYSMLPFKGIKNLETTLADAGNIPVLIYTDPINVETAVEGMKTGIADFVLKDNRKRLLFAVKEILSQTGVRPKKIQKPDNNKNELITESVLNATGDIVYTKDEDLKYIFVNKAFQDFIGKDESEILGKTDTDLLTFEMATSSHFSDKKVIKGKTAIVSSLGKNDNTYEFRKFPVSLGYDKTGVGGIMRSITNRTGKESPLWMLGTTLYQSENAVCITDIKGNILSLNPAFTKLTGFNPEESIGKNPYMLLKSTVHTEEFLSGIWNRVIKGEEWFGAMTSRGKDGSDYFEEVSMQPVPDEKGKIINVIVTRNRISKQKLDEIVNLSPEINYQNLVENAMLGLFTASLQGKFLHVNEAFCTMLGYNSSVSLLNTPIQNVCMQPDQWNRLMETLLTDGDAPDYEIKFRTTRGNERNVILNTMIDTNKIMAVVIDMTRIRKIEEDLIWSKKIAEEAIYLKNDFLVSMSHDIRVPINTINGFLTLLNSHELNLNEKIEYVEMVNKSISKLLKLINNYIEIGKIASGNVSSNPVSFELNQLIRDLWTEFNPLALEKNMMLSYHSQLPDKESGIRFDDQKLKQVLWNLLDNALRYNNQGEVNFGYEVKDTMLELFVKDNDRGINPEKQKYLFDRFRRPDDLYTRKFDGFGLGLPYVKSLVELMGGNIRINSILGKGSAFYINIPFVPVGVPAFQKQTTTTKETINLGNRRILIAEDDETNYFFMERLLSKANVTILRAVNGNEAVERCSSDKNIDLVLMDINMPSLNGLDATRIIKSLSPGLPIIAVTAYAMAHDKESCISAGCDDYIAKPVHKDELFVKLNNCLNN